MSATTAASIKKGNTLYYLHSAIGLLLVFGFAHLPPFGPVTPVGMQVLGIFAGMIYLWSFVSVLWPSLLGIIALGLSDYAPMRTVILNAFGDVVPVLVFFAMVLFGAIQHHRVTNYISRWFLTRRMINGRPLIFSFIFLYTTYVLAALSANILPALLFMWAILYGVLNDVGYKKGETYTKVMIVGTMFAAISGQAAKPFTGSASMLAGAYEKAAGQGLDYLRYMGFGFIMSSISILLFTLLIKYLFRPDMSKIANISIERFQEDKLPPMDLRQKILFVSLFGYLILILLPSMLPHSIAIIALLHTMGAWGIVIALVTALCFFKIEGRPVIDFKEIAGQYVIWDVFFLVCMAMVISAALTDPTTGIAAFLTSTMNPLFGNKSPFMFTVVMVAFSVAIGQVAQNGVMGVLLMPIVYAFSLENGANPAISGTLLAFALHIAILTPGCSPYAAILYSNRQWVEAKDILRYGLVIVVMTILLYIVLGYPLAQLFF
ncbi:MAG: citrate transporter [bacterium]|nr:citrate transporter [bacterium]